MYLGQARGLGQGQAGVFNMLALAPDHVAARCELARENVYHDAGGDY